MRQHLEPNSDHPITVELKNNAARVHLGGAVLVDAGQYFELREASYPPAIYLPRSAADMARLERSDHTSWCPYKGEAAYFHIRAADGSLIENAVWTYETPFSAVAEIKEALAFYPSKIDRIDLG
ncbi:MAG: DUF427 domain-containing protein [Henriciella sp.]|jgi:uncharacterized protein (DUF427 family)